ncbi:MAG: LysE family transporter [Methanobacteriota archaeon]
MSILEILVLGFIIGLTGALAPGPTLIATIKSTIQGGWMSGPWITIGHIIAEVLVVVLIVAGIPFLPPGSAIYIAGVGGAALILFGIMTLKIARGENFTISESPPSLDSPVIAGLITSVSNPYFWIWWFSVGSALLLSSLTSGLTGLVAFMTGHWLSDISWFTFVSVCVHKSRVFIGDREYRFILLICGLILIAFGAWFILSGLSPSH